MKRMKCSLAKRSINARLQYLAIGLFSLSVIVILKEFQRASYANRTRSKKEEIFFRDTSNCEPVKNIAYLKVHKSASSAIQLILLRYGLKHDLHFALPKFSNYLSAKIPFHPSMLSKELIGDFQVNIFAFHAKWSFEGIKSLMPKDTVYIASVREPISLFESLFYYAYMDKLTNMTVDEYAFYTPSNSERHLGFLGYNQMTWDFGLQHEEMYDETAVTNLIRKANEYFDLVLVAENFDESLVLMSRLLCWSYDDVLTLKINARHEKYKHKMKEETLPRLREWLWPDFLLYNHFKSKFERLRREFGPEKMAGEVRELRRVRERTKTECKLTEVADTRLEPEAYKAFSPQVTGWHTDSKSHECKTLLYQEDYFLKILRRKQELEVKGRFGDLRAKLVPPPGALPMKI